MLSRLGTLWKWSTASTLLYAYPVDNMAKRRQPRVLKRLVLHPGDALVVALRPDTTDEDAEEFYQLINDALNGADPCVPFPVAVMVAGDDGDPELRVNRA